MKHYVVWPKCQSVLQIWPTTGLQFGDRDPEQMSPFFGTPTIG